MTNTTNPRTEHVLSGVFVIEHENLDHGNCDLLRRQFSSLDRSQLHLVDVSRVKFADSTGISLLREWSKCVGSGFALVAVNLQLQRCLDRLPKAKRFQQFRTVEEAIASQGSKTNKKTAFLETDCRV